jgi:hypothetical protein
MAIAGSLIMLFVAGGTKAGQAFLMRAAVMLLGAMGLMVAAGFAVLVILALSGNL